MTLSNGTADSADSMLNHPSNLRTLSNGTAACVLFQSPWAMGDWSPKGQGDQSLWTRRPGGVGVIDFFHFFWSIKPLTIFSKQSPIPPILVHGGSIPDLLGFRSWGINPPLTHLWALGEQSHRTKVWVVREYSLPLLLFCWAKEHNSLMGF